MLPGRTNFTLTLSGVQLSDAGSYILEVTDPNITVATRPAILTVLAPPVITSAPIDQTANAGQTVSFSVAATGGPEPTFKWKKNGTTITGATGATLTLSNVSGASTGTYSVVATNTVSSVSASAVLTVNTAPVIATPPTGRTVNIGQTVSFSATASVSGNFTPTLEWRKDGVTTAHGTVTSSSLSFSNGLRRSVTSVLTLTDTQPSDAASYTAVATNTLGTVTSSAAVLKVNTAPVILTQPESKTVTAGQTASFTVSASGTAQFTFQWQRAVAGNETFATLTNGTGISGATTATLSVPKTIVAMSGDRFRAVVTNTLGSASTSVATLTVSKAPATVSLSGLTQTFTGAPRTATAKTNPTGLTVSLSYDGSVTAPTNPGTYVVLATVTAPNNSGSASGSFVITKAPTTVTLSGLAQTFSNSPKSVTASTSPAGLTVNVTYNGSATPPTDAGSYTVVATIESSQRTGSKSGTLVIAKAPQTITFAALPAKQTGAEPFVLTASASSGLPVTYSSSNPLVATITGSMLIIVGKGTATISAAQAGDANRLAAPKVTQKLTVTLPLAATLALDRLTATVVPLNSILFAGSERLRDVAWNGDLYVAVGTGGLILTSSDGLLWKPREAGTTADLLAILWDDTQWLSVGTLLPSGDRSEATGLLLLSPDGINWNISSDPLPATDK